MKFYTIKLPRFLGGIIRAMLGSFKKSRAPEKGALFKVHRNNIM